jgi:CBS domain-containing protein
MLCVICVIHFFLQVQSSLVIFKLLICRWSKLKVSSLNLEPPLSVLPTVTCQEAVDIMKKGSFDQLPVVDDAG